MVSNTLHAMAILMKEGGNWDWFINLSSSDYPLVTQDGSAWMMLSRPFVEYCLWGWDNLPRTVLMYYANVLSSPEGYFHTVICNVEEFKNTTVNHDLHFISWDNPPKQHPHFLTVEDYDKMVSSNAPFARKFGRKEVLMDKIDSELLGSDADGYVPGKWLVRENGNGTLSYAVVKNTTQLKPGPGADRLKQLITKLLSEENFHPKQCTSIPL
ncbi:Beta-glucuronosyltransferase GlcAT14A [Bienertia sinuspersici]